MSNETDTLDKSKTWAALALRVIILPWFMAFAVGAAMANSVLWALDRTFDQGSANGFWEALNRTMR